MVWQREEEAALALLAKLEDEAPELVVEVSQTLMSLMLEAEVEQKLMTGRMLQVARMLKAVEIFVPNAEGSPVLCRPAVVERELPEEEPSPEEVPSPRTMQWAAFSSINPREHFLYLEVLTFFTNKEGKVYLLFEYNILHYFYYFIFIFHLMC